MPSERSDSSARTPPDGASSRIESGSSVFPRGNLAALVSNNYSTRTYPAVDAADAVSCRPDFTVLIYPAHLTDKDNGDTVRPELPITTNTPPTFISISRDDPVRVETR